MIVRHLHKVHELLLVLEEPTQEMHMVEDLLREGGRFPCRRTFERRLEALPQRLPEQIGCLGRYLVELLKGPFPVLWTRLNEGWKPLRPGGKAMGTVKFPVPA